MNGWVVFLMTGAMAVSLGAFLRWKGMAGRSLREEGVLPYSPWKTAKRKNVTIIVTIIIMSMAPLLYTIGQYSSKTLIWVTAGMWMYVILLAFIFSKLINWLRVNKA